MPDLTDSLTIASRIASYAPTVADPATQISGDGFWGEDGFTFDDVIDLINPLQHLPVVSSLYRAMTGDDISNGARIAGGGLFGGPIGIFTAAVGVMFEEVTGGDVIDQMATLFDGEATGGEPAAFAMAAGRPENHDRTIGPAAPNSTSQQPVRTAALELRQSGPDRGVSAFKATPTSTPTLAPMATSVATLAAETNEKAPQPSEATVAGVWLSSIPQVTPPVTPAAENASGGAKVTTISPAAAQLLLEAIERPATGNTTSRAASEVYEQGLPAPTDRNSIIDNLL